MTVFRSIFGIIDFILMVPKAIPLQIKDANENKLDDSFKYSIAKKIFRVSNRHVAHRCDTLLVTPSNGIIIELKFNE